MAEIVYGNHDEEEALRSIGRDCQSLANFVIKRSTGADRRYQSFAHIGIDFKKGVGIFLRLASIRQQQEKAAEVSIVEYPAVDEASVRHSYTVNGENLTSVSPRASTNEYTDISWPRIFDAPQLQDCLSEFMRPEEYEADIDPLALQSEVDAIYKKGTPHRSFEAAQFSMSGLSLVVARRVHMMPEELAGLLKVDFPVIDECKVNVVIDRKVIGRTKIVHGRSGLVLETVDQGAEALAKFYRDNIKDLEKGSTLIN